MSTPALEVAPSVPILLARGLIGILEGLNLAAYVQDGQPFPDVETPGVAAAVLVAFPASPDRLVTFTPYPVTDDPAQAMSTVGVQVRSRWAGANPRAVANYSDAVFGALHGLTYVTLSTGVTMSQCLRRSGGSMGQDPQRRWTWSDNYYCDVDYPSSTRS